MDKNYNVDDILSEIKRKKSTEKAATSPPTGTDTPEGRGDFVLQIPEEELGADTTRGHRPERSSVSPFAAFAAGDGAGANTTLDGDEPHHNPLNYAGEAQSITDKAKNRRGFAERVRQVGQANKNKDKGEFHFNADPGVQEDAFGKTQVLNKFSTGKELNLKDIKAMDFSGHMGAQPIYEEDADDMERAGAKMRSDFSEYNAVENRDSVATDIAHTKLWLFLRVIFTTVLTFCAFWFALSGKYGALPMPEAIWPEGETIRSFMIASTVLTALVALVNSSAMGGGLISFFKLRANSDSLAAFAVLAAVAQGIGGIVKPELVDPAGMNYYFAMACLAMLFNSLGKLLMINRIQTNFRILGSDREKRAILAVESPDFCQEFIGPTRRKPIIAYGVKADFFTDFLALSYSDKYDVGVNRSVAPVCVAGALVVGVATYFLGGNLSLALSALTAILCVGATLSATFVENVPLSKIARRGNPLGGMISGGKAVEDFCDSKAVLLTEKDLFGAGFVTLSGIKAFSQGRIDEAILDAASVVCALDGALAPLFLEMVSGEERYLKKVDNITFENDMGVSAWIDARRILIGNRKLMINHGIPLPEDSYERGERQDVRGEPIYISSLGEVSARFLVEYHGSSELAEALDGLAVRDIQLLVAAGDPNINAQKISEIYGYPEDLITILSSDRLAEYRQMAAPRQEAGAEIIYTGKAVAMVQGLLSCISARSAILTATVIELVQVVLGYGIIAFMAFMGTIDTLSVVMILAYQLFWFAVVAVVQQLTQP